MNRPLLAIAVTTVVSLLPIAAGAAIGKIVKHANAIPGEYIVMLHPDNAVGDSTALRQKGKR